MDQNKIMQFLKENINLVAIAILIFAFLIRLKYVGINSAIWWDEGEYLSMAKSLAFDTPYQITPVRQLVFPLLIAFLYKLGITSLTIIKFFTVLIPSTLSVLLIYLIGKEMYSKQVGMISSFIMSVFWISLFWSARVSTDIIGLFFSLLAFYTFWRGYVKKISPKLNLSIAGVALSLGFLTRIGNALSIVIILLFLLITSNIKFLKNKNLYLTAVFALVCLIPYLLWNKLKFGSYFAFTTLYVDPVKDRYITSTPFFWDFFSFFKIYLFNPWFIFFIAGLFLLYKMIIGFDLVVKNADKELTADLFSLLTIIVPTVYFVALLRQSTTEPRWAMVMVVGIFFLTSKALIKLYDLTKKHITELGALALVVLILLTGAYYQLSQADALIENKRDTYYPLKPAGLWMKENSSPGDIILTKAEPQTSYYTDRKIMGIAGTEAEMLPFMEKYKPKYLEITSLERYPEWIYDWPERNQDKVRPVQVYFFDEEKTQLAVVVYEFIYKENESITNTSQI